ncbi:MAG: PQQ-binding-like beta-propeller repeat protein, partial [Acidimicrobiales bacterium]
TGTVALGAAPAWAGPAAAGSAGGGSGAPRLVWERLVPATIVASSPNVADLAGGPSVVVGATDGKLYAYHLGDGSRVQGWPVSTPEPVASSPAVATRGPGRGDIVITGSGTAGTVGLGGLYAFGPEGHDLWARRVPSVAYPGKPSSAVPASTALGVLSPGQPLRATAGVVGEAIYSVQAGSGVTAPGWPYHATDSVYSSPALAPVPGGGGVDVIEGGDASSGASPDEFQGGRVYALDPAGRLVWEWRTDDVVTSSPAVGRLDGPSSPPEVVVGGGDYWYRQTGHHTTASTSVTALSMSGKVLWRKDLGGITTDSPALADLLGNGQLDVVEGTIKGADDKIGGPRLGEGLGPRPFRPGPAGLAGRPSARRLCRRPDLYRRPDGQRPPGRARPHPPGPVRLRRPRSPALACGLGHRQRLGRRPPGRSSGHPPRHHRP